LFVNVIIKYYYCDLVKEDGWDAYKIFVGKPVGNRQHGRPGCRWEDDIIMDLRERSWEAMEWMHPAQDKDQCGRFL